MEIADILTPDGVIAKLKARSKKQVLQELANHAERLTGLPAREIFDVLLRRERLGSTGIGQGVAIPHGKLPQLDRIHAMFARLAQPTQFDAVDEAPVDLVFLLLAPEGAGADHLKALSRISRLLRDGNVIAKLRLSREPAALYAILTESAASHAAA
jgi:PTS system nitrogen regulatory IIA component